jgi:ligand-binding sensor domain-containing protein/class 3 adenylate cyclase/predicted metal-dependent HD superfamily phosphohydrolase
MYKHFVTLLLFVCCLLNSKEVFYAQSIYHFKNYTINEGLSQSSVLCILQDDNYGLWMGTQDGLNRFDGKSFEVFTSEDTKGLGGNFIHSMLADSKGDLWIATGNGLVHRNKKTDAFTTYNPKEDIIEIEHIAYNQNDNTIWMATSRRGVWTFNIKTKVFESKTSIFSSRLVKKIFISKEGIIFVASENHLLEAYNPNTGQQKTILFNSKNGTPVDVNHMYQITDGEIIIGTNQGVYKCTTSTFQTSSFFNQLDKQYGYLNVSGMLHTKEKYWYITTVNKGLFTISPDGNIVNSTEDMFQKNALIYNTINAIYEDKNKTIWLATSRGISGFNPENQGFLGVSVSADLKHGLPSPSIWSIAQDEKAENIYIGTDVGISKFDRKKRYFTHYQRQNKNTDISENSEIAVLDIFCISQTRLLAACMDGFYELTISANGNHQYKPIPFITPELFEQHKRVYKIVHYRGDSYFLATKSGVLLVDFDKKTVTEFKNNPKDPKNSILPGICRLAFQDSQGRIFFATSSGGLSILDEKNPNNLNIIPYPKNNYLSNNMTSYFSTMTEVKKGEFYLGTAGDGILHWDESVNKAKMYSKKDGLPNNVVYASVIDNQNNMWISTNKGLSKFDLKTKETFNFSEIHGLLSNEFNMGAGLASKNGMLYFGGISGLVFFDPETLNKYNYNVSIVLTKFKLDNKWVTSADKNSPLTESISYTKELVLNYRQRSFSIRFQTDNLSNTELINYKYLLEGSDEGEVEIGGHNELRFNSLSPGDYTLKLYARVGYGKWISQPKILHIIIKPPFWNAWWFWTSVVVAALIIIRFSIRKRIEYERREQVRLEMKIAERTAEIRAQNIKIEKQSKQLEIEKEKSERLLRNVIPDSMADELLEKGQASARAFKVVSVMFTDFVGFTKIADTMKPGDLVKKLDVFFRKFDEIIFNNNLERIKTIGDAYMAAGGVPVRNNTNPIDTCLAGIQIQHYIKELEKEAIDAGETPWKLRLGINTGEVTAGVIGTKRLAYDVWGSTVNYAQRMEMLGEPGKVAITHNTYLHIEPYFECTYKGLVSAKGDGKIQMYQVERIKPELSIDGQGIFPNERFHKIVNLHHYSSINYYKAERFILRKLEAELSSKLHYHSIEHTKDVVQAVERLALSENVTDEGLFLLKTAASYHDAGFVEQYDKNEPIGVRLASEILPKYGYTPEHIEIIKELIFVTSVPHKPQNQLEEIICDADLDYLGRDDFHEIADRLRKELREHGKITSDRKWDEIQVLFLTQHKYFTKTSKQTRDAKKEQNLQEIKDRLKRDEYKD